MGGSEKQQTQQTQTNTINPEQLAMLKDNYSGAQTRAGSLTPYTGPLTAGFNPTQTQSQGILSRIALDPSYGLAANGATDAAKGVLNTDVYSADNIAKYMNPFTTDVIDAANSDNERAREIARNYDHMQDTAGSAFGGSRSGVSDSLTNEAYDRNSVTSNANLRSAGFTNAQTAASNDATLKLNAARSVADLNNNGLSVAANQGGILASVGDAQQAQRQKEITDAYQAYQAGQQLTIAQQNIINSALGLIPAQQTVNSSGTSTTSSNPGLGGILSSIGKIGMTAAAFA